MSSSRLLVGVVVTGPASPHRAALDAAALCPAAHIDHIAISVVDFCAHMHSNIACSTAVCAACANNGRDSLQRDVGRQVASHMHCIDRNGDPLMPCL